MLSKRLLLSLFPLLAIAATAQEQTHPGRSFRAVREVVMGSAPGTSSTYFRLDYLAAGDTPGDGPFGAVRWLTGPAQGEPNTWRGECEVQFLETGKRISHLEQLGRDQRSLSYRELTGSFGRRLLLTWSADGSVVAIDRGGRQRRRRELALTKNAAFPLALVELARRGQPLPPKMMVYQPLSGEFELLSLQVLHDIESRTLRLSRADGSSAGSYRFEGNQLISFRWQAGGVIATRIEREEFQRISGEPLLIEASASLLEDVPAR